MEGFMNVYFAVAPTDENALEEYFKFSDTEKKNYRLITYTEEDNKEHIQLIRAEDLSITETIKGIFGTSRASMSNVARVCSQIPNIPYELLHKLDSSIQKYNDSRWFEAKKVVPSVQFSIERNLILSRAKKDLEKSNDSNRPIIEKCIGILTAMPQDSAFDPASEYFSEAVQSIFGVANDFNCGCIAKTILEKAPTFIDKEEELRTGCSRGSNKVIKLLLEKGANVNVQTDEGVTPLMISAAKGHIESVKILLSSPGINPHLKDNNGKNALHHADSGSQPNIAKELLKHGVRRYSADLL
jgi:hypothetical protein